ncbi:hypothetical protein DPMN_153406 [Dreissena polymorpha]|uniref:Uncharacterized protein n=1 Tax=Dreissena polymorpha TaxID=45954 RepID=A0A9D4J621_DREPO|nr:hypothetical protein DPMN_153406 [Dreissena polymorpha]
MPVRVTTLLAQCPTTSPGILWAHPRAASRLMCAVRELGQSLGTGIRSLTVPQACSCLVGGHSSMASSTTSGSLTFESGLGLK